MYYKSQTERMGIPQDDAAFDFVEQFLLETGDAIRMMEIEIICAAFFYSERPFKIPSVSITIAKRFFLLLQTKLYPWTNDSHGTFKQLAKDQHRDAEEMRLLGPALDASGFFEHCLKSKCEGRGLHDVHYLLNYLCARSYHDRALLDKCADIVKNMTEQHDFRNLRSKDLERTLRAFARLNYPLDDTILKVFVDSYRSQIVPECKEAFGVSILGFLHAVSLYGIYPFDIIDAFFSSDLVRVSNGELPGM